MISSRRIKQINGWIAATERQINHSRPDLRDDLYQRGWETALKADMTHDSTLGYSYKSWMIQALRRDMKRLLRAERKHGVNHEDIEPLLYQDGISELLDEDTEPRIEAQVDIFALVDKLPERDANVVKLHYIDDLSEHEIGERLGVSRSMVRKIKNRAVQKLKALVG